MTTKECKSCKTSNPVSASFCRKCGHRFPEHTKQGKNALCHIENFSVKKQTNGKFVIEWNAINADRVTINEQVVTGQNKFVITVNGIQSIVLRAENATSFDVKEWNVVYELQTIYKDKVVYKDKIVEKKVKSGSSGITTFFLIVFLLLSILLMRYAYQLEDRNYDGTRYFSDMFGHKPYLLVNGSNDDRMVQIPAQGASIMLDIKTNASEYDILDLPNWCTLDKKDTCIIIKADKNKQMIRKAIVRIVTNDKELDISLVQDVYKKPKRLLVNGKKVIDSNLSVTSGQVTYKIDSDADSYKIISLPSWIKVITKSTDSFTISYDENTTNIERQGWFMVKAEGLSVKIKLTQEAKKITKKITGEIKDITVVHNVFKDGVKGMKILVDFSVQNMKGIDGSCAVYFYYENGNRVKDSNGSYATSDNQAATHKTIKPSYDNSSYTDVEIFMPYNELEVGTGKHSLKFYCKIWENSISSAVSVTQSQYYSFTLTNN